MVAGLAGRRAGGRTPFLSTRHRQCIVLFPVAGGKTLLFWDHCGDAGAQDHPLVSLRCSDGGGSAVCLVVKVCFSGWTYQLLFV